MTPEAARAGIEAICLKMGAPLEQARRMAAQLYKRSEQLAVERQITQVEALDHLLRLLISGSNGEAGQNVAPQAGYSGGVDSKNLKNDKDSD